MMDGTKIILGMRLITIFLIIVMAKTTGTIMNKVEYTKGLESIVDSLLLLNDLYDSAGRDGLSKEARAIKRSIKIVWKELSRIAYVFDYSKSEDTPIYFFQDIIDEYIKRKVGN